MIVANPIYDSVFKKMVVEDEILSELAEWERSVAVQRERAAAAEKRAEEERTQKEEERRLKDEALAREGEERRQKEEERRQREALAARLETGVKSLVASGMAEADARKLLGG